MNRNRDRNGEVTDVSSKLQEEPEGPTEQPSEDIILQINPASTKDEKKLNKDVNGTYICELK